MHCGRRRPHVQVLRPPGVMEDAREDHDVARARTSQFADTAAAALSGPLPPREVPGTRAVTHVPGLAGVLAGWAPCGRAFWKQLDLRASPSRWSVRCCSSSRGRDV